MHLLDELGAFFFLRAPLDAGETLLVAFSGGPDSTALLWGMRELAEARRFQVAALHVDHATDPGSAGRAAAAQGLAARLGVPCTMLRIDVPALRSPGEASEEAGRRLRYAALEGERLRLGARYAATAHHRDDQSETVALRLLFGSGLEGLAGILARRGEVVRPLLALTRRDLERGLEELAARPSAPGGEIRPLLDPTNADLARPRNRLRHSILPHLERSEPGSGERLARLAERAERARKICESRLEEILEPETIPGALPSGAAIRLSSFAALPDELRPLALSLLHRVAGAPHPPPASARSELLRQLADLGHREIGCDCGSGWRWRRRLGDRLALLPPPPPEPRAIPQFTYTLQIPGEVEIPEIAARIEVWPDTGDAADAGDRRAAGSRVGLSFPAGTGSTWTVRSRRPGDRLRPLGAPGTRRLKEVLIDRRVPRGERDRIPLLCCDGRIAWVPGVTIDQRFRQADEGTSWIAEITYS